MTGAIAWVEIQLARSPAATCCETHRVRPSRRLLRPGRGQRRAREHTAAWIDCTASGRPSGAASSSAGTGRRWALAAERRLVSLPITPRQPAQSLSCPGLQHRLWRAAGVEKGAPRITTRPSSIRSTRSVAGTASMAGRFRPVPVRRAASAAKMAVREAAQPDRARRRGLRSWPC